VQIIPQVTDLASHTSLRLGHEFGHGAAKPR